MRSALVKIGGSYFAKVSGKTVQVVILDTHPLGGWVARNMETNRTVRIHSGRRLKRYNRIPNNTDLRYWDYIRDNRKVSE